MSNKQQLLSLITSIEQKQSKFENVLAFINTNFVFKETAFTNGDLSNSATENQGSCCVFAVAQLFDLSKEQTLVLFAEHYDNVLENPNTDNHQNIRQFMKNGWNGIQFEQTPLTEK